MIIEETKEHTDPLLGQLKEGEILFTTRKNDPEYIHMKNKPISFVATNIPSFMGGRADPWRQASGRVGLKNPYSTNQ